MSPAAYVRNDQPGMSNRYGDKLQMMSGPIEVRFKGGTFSSWSELYVRLEGRWIAMYKRERDASRLAAIELGPGVNVTDLDDVDAATKFTRRFDIRCLGGVLPEAEISFRTKSRKDRDLWVLAIGTNIHLLSSVGLDLNYGVWDLEPVISHLKDALPLTALRIRSDLSIRSASGENIVSFLVRDDMATDRAHAVLIGRRLLSMNVLHHVTWDKDFVDSVEPYIVTELEDDDSKYQVEHFQKFMDSRKFWKYFDKDGFSSSSSGGNASRRLQASQNSSHDSASEFRSSATNHSSTYVSVHSQDRQPPVPGHPPRDRNNMSSEHKHAMKKAKLCTVCGKSFNPLRRRYFCRVCQTIICSACCVARTSDAVDESAPNVRLCIGCKLANNTSGDTYAASLEDSFEGYAPSIIGSQSNPSEASRSSNVSSERRMTSQTRPNASPISRNGSRSANASSGQSKHKDMTNVCQLCNGEACSPVEEVEDIPYDVAEVSQDASGNVQYVAAAKLDNEAERMKSVRIIQNGLAHSSTANYVLPQLTSIASIATRCPMVVIGLLTDDEYILISEFGVQSPMHIPREQSLGAHACRYGRPLVCSDLSSDIRFAGNPRRRSTLKSCFYIGIPITLSNGHTVGALEIMDTSVRLECVNIIAHSQAVVRGLHKKFEGFLSRANELTNAPGPYKNPQFAPADVAPSADVVLPQAQAHEPTEQMESRLRELYTCDVCDPVADISRIPYPVYRPSNAARGCLAAVELDNETERLQTVRIIERGLAVSPTASYVLPQMSSMAALATQCPIALIGLLTSDEYVLISVYGSVGLDNVPREQAVATHTCRYGHPLACSDLPADVRFSGNEWRKTYLKDSTFYVGVPITLSNGHTVGALEVFDTNAGNECSHVMDQMQSVLKGLHKKFEGFLARANELENMSVPKAKEEVKKEPANASETQMEDRLMDLLSQTSNTQEQLKNQQGTMMSSISSHSKQISDLAKQLERMESALASKLDG